MGKDRRKGDEDRERKRERKKVRGLGGMVVLVLHTQISINLYCSSKSTGAVS